MDNISDGRIPSDSSLFHWLGMDEFTDFDKEILKESCFKQIKSVNVAMMNHKLWLYMQKHLSSSANKRMKSIPVGDSVPYFEQTESIQKKNAELSLDLIDVACSPCHSIEDSASIEIGREGEGVIEGVEDPIRLENLKTDRPNEETAPLPAVDSMDTVESTELMIHEEEDSEGEKEMNDDADMRNKESEEGEERVDDEGDEEREEKDGNDEKKEEEEEVKEEEKGDYDTIGGDEVGSEDGKDEEEDDGIEEKEEKEERERNKGECGDGDGIENDENEKDGVKEEQEDGDDDGMEEEEEGEEEERDCRDEENETVNESSKALRKLSTQQNRKRVSFEETTEIASKKHCRNAEAERALIVLVTDELNKEINNVNAVLRRVKSKNGLKAGKAFQNLNGTQDRDSLLKNANLIMSYTDIVEREIDSAKEAKYTRPILNAIRTEVASITRNLLEHFDGFSSTKEKKKGRLPHLHYVKHDMAILLLRKELKVLQKEKGIMFDLNHLFNDIVYEKIARRTETEEETTLKLLPVSLPFELHLNRCKLCLDFTHDSINCDKYFSFEERDSRRRELKLCQYCLVECDSNRCRNCSEKKACKHCCNGHYHHISMCRFLQLPCRNEKKECLELMPIKYSDHQFGLKFIENFESRQNSM